MIIRTNRELKEHYHRLEAGDRFIGLLSAAHIRNRIFVDLLERGVLLFPSALAQTLAGSKTAQAVVFKPWMIPQTTVITRRADLLHTCQTYTEQGIKAVVTKKDGLHCGFGVHRWDHIEMVYNHASLQPGWFPFVVQPFLSDYKDIRIVTAGDYWEAYQRVNEHHFRQNLSVGGESLPYTLDETLFSFCRTVMKRGKFPYAHIDVLITPDGTPYLSEIALNGGLKGAQIEKKALDTLKKKILEKAAGL